MISFIQTEPTSLPPTLRFYPLPLSLSLLNTCRYKQEPSTIIWCRSDHAAAKMTPSPSFLLSLTTKWSHQHQGLFCFGCQRDQMRHGRGDDFPFMASSLLVSRKEESFGLCLFFLNTQSIQQAIHTQISLKIYKGFCGGLLESKLGLFA